MQKKSYFLLIRNFTFVYMYTIPDLIESRRQFSFYHKIPSFNDPVEGKKKIEKRENAGDHFWSHLYFVVCKCFQIGPV